MKAFAALYGELDGSTSTGAKVDALRRYFASADPADAAWAAYFLAGGKPRQVVPTATLRQLACQVAGIEDWLFEECYQEVGDLAETIAHVLPAGGGGADLPLAAWMEQRLLPLRGQPPQEQGRRIAAWWDELDMPGRFLLTKLIGGGFRVGVSRLLVQRAIAEGFGLDPQLVAQRMMGYTDAGGRPDAARFAALVAPPGEGAMAPGHPYPFYLAHAIDLEPSGLAERLGDPRRWLVEWKFDGIRAQVVRRAGGVWVWSRGEELMTERFPEIAGAAAGWPEGTVLDGEVLVVREPLQGTDWRPLPFQLLQQRIGRRHLTRKVLAEAPVAFVAYDLLEESGVDLRSEPQGVRRERLDALARRAGIAVSPLVEVPAAQGADGPEAWRAGWEELRARRAQSRERGVEGFMLKHRDARYGVGRRKSEDGGGWLKWKIEPLAIDAVLVYAQAGHGRRASLYTDYTFAVWSRPPRDAAEAAAALDAPAAGGVAEGALQLVPVAKAYSGLTDEEIVRVDRVIRQTTREKFGPVRSVRPTLVFEIGFEGINRSPRHKSGVALRFPRMLRWRDDKPVHEADSMREVEALLSHRPGTGST